MRKYEIFDSEDTGPVLCLFQDGTCAYIYYGWDFYDPGDLKAALDAFTGTPEDFDALIFDQYNDLDRLWIVDGESIMADTYDEVRNGGSYTLVAWDDGAGLEHVAPDKVTASTRRALALDQ